MTGTRVKVLGSGSAYLYTVNFYDKKNRVIQAQSSNVTGGTDIQTTQYNWQGQPLVSILKQEKSSPNAQTTVAVSKMTYDSLWRVVKTEKKVSHSQVNSGNMPGSWTTTAEQEYNALGQLKKKKLDPAYNSNAGLDSLTYDYNIRGWMLGMNRLYAKDVHQNNYFGFDLGYDKTQNGIINNQSYATPQYNGNISGMVWKSKGDAEKRKYDFTYDAANRILSADFNQYTSSSFNKTAGVDFSMSGMSYDANGNILTMKQRGYKVGGSATIDSLAYAYIDYSNKLKNVIDGLNDAQTRLGDFRASALYLSSGSKNTSTVDYTYDANGNLVKDLNKDIVTYAGGNGIEYNYLNLPQKITVKKDGSNNKGTIEYTYDATGNKLKKAVYEPGVDTTTTLYIAGNVYRNDTLEFISYEEGRIRKKGTTALVYDYMLKDHLGNVRMLLTTERDTSFYPAATMEDATIAAEEVYYGNLVSTQGLRPGWFSDPSYSTNGKVARLRNASGLPSIGPNMLLKVMAGDSYNIRVAAGWESGTASNSSTNVLTELLGILSSGVAGASGGKVSSGDLQSGSGSINGALSDFMSGQTTSGTKPKAYLNWIVLDEQFRVARNSAGDIIAGGYSGFEQVGAGGSAQVITKTGLSVAKSGYLFIYTSSEATNMNVFFDNLQVTHIRGPILEETHYYPFGLTTAGISSKALAFGEPGNNRKWNVGSELASKEFSDGSGLELYETFYRSIDPQIGRFWQIDPEFEAQENSSPYESMGNNPISNMDPLGDFKTKFGAKWHRFWHGGGAVQKNEYDEWYVSKSKVEDDGNGGTVVKSWKYYGKGRDKYSTVREALLKDYAIMEDIQQKGDASMYQMYDSPEDAGKAALSLGVGVVLPNPVLKTGTNAANATQVVANGTTKVLSRAERLQLFKESILNAPMPKNPKEALKLINKILDKIEDAHAGANDRMYGILDKKYVTTRSDGGLTALTKGHRIEISTNGSFSIYERATGNLFLTK